MARRTGSELREEARLFGTRERDEEIAAAMGKLLSDARKTGKRSARSGTQRARTQPETRLMTITNGALITPPTWAGTTGAGDGNRTRMTSLEGV